MYTPPMVYVYSAPYTSTHASRMDGPWGAAGGRLLSWLHCTVLIPNAGRPSRLPDQRTGADEDILCAALEAVFDVGSERAMATLRELERLQQGNFGG